MDEFVFLEIELGSGVKVEKEVLGKAFEFRVYGIDAAIEFPQLSSALTHTTYSSEKHLAAPESIRGRYGDELEWGEVMAIDRNDEIEVSVKKVVLIMPFTNQKEGEIIITKVDIIERSIDLFKQYLSIYTKESFAQKYYDIRPDIKYVTSKKTRQELDRKFSSKYPFVGYINRISYKAINSELINKILTYVSRLKEPPIEYQLLLEARKLFYQQKYRSTVFECASAAEVLATSKLEAHCEICSSNSLKKRMKNCRGLMPKYNLASSLILFNKSYSLNILARLRNDAIHAGKTVERKEATEALKITDEFIYSEITGLF